MNEEEIELWAKMTKAGNNLCLLGSSMPRAARNGMESKYQEAHRALVLSGLIQDIKKKYH